MKRRAGVARLLVQAVVLLVAVAAVLSFGGRADADTPTSPSSILIPPQQIPLLFDHARHLARGIRCEDCHTNARSSRVASDRLLPSPVVCDRCHGSDHANLDDVKPGPQAAGGCARCHEGYDARDGNRVRRVVIGRPLLRFDHRAHALRNIGCERCHARMDRVGMATREQLPTMRACLGCHDLPAESRGDASSACATCHLVGSRGTMITHFPTGTIMPPAWLKGARHGPEFARTHGAVAGNDSRFCASCHTEDQCAACHDGRVRPRAIHPNDYLSMHAVDATQHAQRCSSCHRAESFCKTCHLRSGVTQSGPAWARQARGRFHPPPEVFTTGPRTSRHHAVEARRNLSACVGCHLERDCVSCHASRTNLGAGVSPHPAGFAGRCGPALRKNPRSCLVCHEPDAPSWTRCR